MFITAALFTMLVQASDQPLPRAQYLQEMDMEFTMLDADKNGIVTPAEVAQKLTSDSAAQAYALNRQIFERLDIDGSGQLSPQEFAGLVAAPPPADTTNFMARLDLNKDGQVTLVEHRTVMLATFDNIDADKDGVVTPAEMQNALVQ